MPDNVSVRVSETGRPSWPAATLIMLVGFQLRSITVGVPPVLPELRAELHLSFAATGALTGISVLGLGIGALPGAVLVNRFGARRVVGAATLGLGLAALLRLSPPLPYSLFIWTAVLALLIATAQPAIAVLIRNWFPTRIQQASTIYAMSLGLGALAGATLSVYLLAFGWRGSFVVWAVLALLAAGAWIWLAPGRGSSYEPLPHGLRGLVGKREVWHVAALFGGQSLVFYGGTTWIPFLLHNYSRAYLALVLFLFQVGTVPFTAILATIRRPWATSRFWYVAGGLTMTVGSLGLMLGLTGLAWLWAPLAGLGSTMVFAGTNSLPATWASDESEVAGYTALTLMAGYAFAFFGPMVGGLLLDNTRIITSPFWVTTAAAVMTAVLGAMLSKRPAVRSQAALSQTLL